MLGSHQHLVVICQYSLFAAKCSLPVTSIAPNGLVGVTVDFILLEDTVVQAVTPCQDGFTATLGG